MEPKNSIGWQSVKAILFVIVLTGLFTALYLYFTEPLESNQSGGFLTWNYEARRQFAFVFGLIVGGVFGAFLSPPLVAIRTRSVLLLTLYGLLTGLVIFALYYWYKLSYIHSTWSDAYTINEMSKAAFNDALHAIFICTGIGLLTSLAKRITMKT